MRSYARCLAPMVAALALCSASLLGQSEPPTRAAFDRAAFGQALTHAFDRDEGTPIREEQKRNLERLLREAGDADLGEWGYAPALASYFRRDPVAGVAALETFFAKHERIPVPEHATMAGRIYLVASVEELRKPAEERNHANLCRWAERVAALYPDLAAVGRMAVQVLAKSPDPKAYRVALVRGLRRSTADDEAVEALLATIYEPRDAAPTGGADRVPSLSGAFAARETPTSDATAAAAPTERTSTVDPSPVKPPAASRPTTTSPGAANLLAGPIEATVGAQGEFAFESLRGKVVVLELFASWNPPSRAGAAELQTLVATYGERASLVSVTRFYGRGMDFQPNDAVPHGGTLRDRLDREAELDLHRRLHTALGLTRPIAFVGIATWRDAFKAGVLPTLLVLDRDGKQVARIEGAPETAHRELRAVLDRATAASTDPGKK
ncbi:MAG: Redoxin [Planctomycetota bacterium]